MSRTFWTGLIAFDCIFWGTAVLTGQHHLSALIPTLGGWLLTTGIGLTVLFFLFGRKP